MLAAKTSSAVDRVEKLTLECMLYIPVRGLSTVIAEISIAYCLWLLYSKQSMYPLSAYFTVCNFIYRERELVIKV